MKCGKVERKVSPRACTRCEKRASDMRRASSLRCCCVPMFYDLAAAPVESRTHFPRPERSSQLNLASEFAFSGARPAETSMTFPHALESGIVPPNTVLILLMHLLQTLQLWQHLRACIPLCSYSWLERTLANMLSKDDGAQYEGHKV